MGAKVWCTGAKCLAQWGAPVHQAKVGRTGAKLINFALDTVYSQVYMDTMLYVYRLLGLQVVYRGLQVVYRWFTGLFVVVLRNEGLGGMRGSLQVVCTVYSK